MKRPQSTPAVPGPAPRPVESVDGLEGYRITAPLAPVDLHLDANEGAPPPPELLQALAGSGGELFCRYPDAGPLEALLAERLGLGPDEVLVTAGGDDAIERVCRAFLGPGRELILPEPTFEMLGRYARLAGARVISVPWPGGAFPTDAVIASLRAQTAVIAVVSPQNPTGLVAAAEDLERLSAAAPGAVLLADLAYTEFARRDLTPTALRLPNAVVVRSLSKAWGMAGLRVGWAAGPAALIGRLRAAGHPYAVSRPSLVLAEARLRSGAEEVAAFVDRVRRETAALTAELIELGARPWPSQANFVLARFRDAAFVHAALGALGIAVRIFQDQPALAGCLRITCPGDPDRFERLRHALGTILAPQALLFDLDGVLADVSRSYRRAILETAAYFGLELDPTEVSEAKTEPGSNNDWEVSRRLLARRGIEAPLKEVTARFEELYQGTPERPGLCRYERLLPDRSLFERLRRRVRLGVVTGRPRNDAARFLRAAGVESLFETVVTREEAPLKPDPAPVQLALARLGIRRAWMVGDTPDDMRAARAAGVLPIGVVASGEELGRARSTLAGAGAARVLERLDLVEELLP